MSYRLNILVFRKKIKCYKTRKSNKEYSNKTLKKPILDINSRSICIDLTSLRFRKLKQRFTKLLQRFNFLFQRFSKSK